jgi:hypothetical protein
MASSNGYRDNEPITHVGRLPIYVSTILVTLHFLGICLSAVILGSAMRHILIPFDPELVFKHGKWWTPFTYTFVEKFDLLPICGLFLFYRGAVEIEKFYGRWHVLRLFTLLLITPPAVSTLFWVCGSNEPGLMLIGSFFLSLTFFVAFATLYPNIEFLGTISPKAICIFVLAIACAYLAAQKSLIGVSILLVCAGVAHFYVVSLRAAGDAGMGSFFRGLLTMRRRPRKPHLVVLPPPPRREIPKAEMVEEETPDEVDALLDKIAKSGIGSLTPGERAQLEKAREDLLKKERQ